MTREKGYRKEMQWFRGGDRWPGQCEKEELVLGRELTGAESLYSWGSYTEKKDNHLNPCCVAHDSSSVPTSSQAPG